MTLKRTMHRQRTRQRVPTAGWLTGARPQMGCGGLCLPAAKETIATWISGFGFGPMPFEREARCRRELHILVFPGTRLLVRDFHPVCQSPVLGAGSDNLAAAHAKPRGSCVGKQAPAWCRGWPEDRCHACWVCACTLRHGCCSAGMHAEQGSFHLQCCVLRSDQTRLSVAGCRGGCAGCDSRAQQCVSTSSSGRDAKRPARRRSARGRRC